MGETSREHIKTSVLDMLILRCLLDSQVIMSLKQADTEFGGQERGYE